MEAVLEDLIRRLHELKMHFNKLSVETEDAELKMLADGLSRRKEMQYNEIVRSFHVNLNASSPELTHDDRNPKSGHSDEKEYLSTLFEKEKEILNSYEEALKNSHFEEVQKFILRHQRQDNLKEMTKLEGFLSMTS